MTEARYVEVELDFAETSHEYRDHGPYEVTWEQRYDTASLVIESSGTEIVEYPGSRVQSVRVLQTYDE